MALEYRNTQLNSFSWRHVWDNVMNVEYVTDYEKYEDRIPPLTLEALRNYIEYGVPTGGFLHSVLTDSLFGAYGQADSGNRETLGDIVMFIYNEAPNGCWGSQDHVKEWLEKEGRQGRDAFRKKLEGKIAK